MTTDENVRHKSCALSEIRRSSIDANKNESSLEVINIFFLSIAVTFKTTKWNSQSQSAYLSLSLICEGCETVAVIHVLFHWARLDSVYHVCQFNQSLLFIIDSSFKKGKVDMKAASDNRDLISIHCEFIFLDLRRHLWQTSLHSQLLCYNQFKVSQILFFARKRSLNHHSECGNVRTLPLLYLLLR